MATHDIIVIGASAGGVEAICTLVAELPRDLRAAVLVVLHVARGRSIFPEILTRVGRLPAVHPADGDRIHYGRIYVAPPDRHLTVAGDAVRIAHGPTENGVRPAVDPLFRSAARAYGPRVIGVVLTGSLDDGTAGLAAVKEAHGVAIVQDPAEAFAPSMPRSAQQHVAVDHVLPLREIAPLLVSLTHEGAGAAHLYASDSMVAAQTGAVDRASWGALRALQERAALTRRLADRARAKRHPSVARAFDERARAAEEQVEAVRQVVSSRSAAHVEPEHTLEASGPDQPAAVNERDI